ncbi:MAG: HAD family hydrolase [Euryarchaeota archaeon]|nr:HAD family hydrolase [Euryarchaeota archaeon]MBT5184237.1 HAD family hydrolase [Euryarchaeota archaeon]
MSETRIAMWSGPRNISTAMMYSFDNRPDSYCSDEPLYAHYLARTGVTHPGAQNVVASGETDWKKVVDFVCGDIPNRSEIWYQKHMTHHLLPHIGLDWVSKLTNCLLIRDPREVLLSMSKKTDQIDVMATGLPQQNRLFDHLLETTGEIPTIIDSGDILKNPEGMLSKLCDVLEIPFDKSMLSWQAGPRECDGIWAKYWYDSVWESTGFAQYRSRIGELSPEYQVYHDECQVFYDRLHSFRLK